MKGLKTVFVGLFICISAYGQIPEKGGRESANLIGADVASLLTDGSVGIRIGHAFSGHWSIMGEAGICTSRLRRQRTDEEKIQYEELYGEKDETDNEIRDLFICTADIAFWPSQSLKGVYFRAGLKLGERSGPDCRVGIGYMFRIWKMINGDISYTIDMIESYDSGVTKGKGTSIGINIIF